MGFFSKSPPPTAESASWIYLISPGSGPDEWNVWKRIDGKIVNAGSTPLRGKAFAHTATCWPAASTLTLPVWIAEGGDAAKIIGLELEARGAIRPGDFAAFAFDEIAREDGRRLHAVHLLRDGKSNHPHLPVRWFDAITRWLPVQSDAIHLWLENGSICYALTRGKNVVFADTLRNAEPTDTDFRSIRRVIQRLQGEGVLAATFASIVAFTPAAPAWKETARRTFPGLAFREVDRHPTPPPTLHDIPSTRVADFRNAAKIRAKARTTALALAAIVAVLAMLTGIRFAREVAEIRHLETTIAAQSAEVDRLVGIARDWQVVEPALTPSFYPLDILRDCAAQLPDTGARLTVFSVDGPEVVLQGEAASHPAAFSFAESVKKSGALAQYEWEIPQPNLLPNNTASFQMRGTRRSNEKTGL